MVVEFEHKQKHDCLLATTKALRPSIYWLREIEGCREIAVINNQFPLPIELLNHIPCILELDSSWNVVLCCMNYIVCSLLISSALRFPYTSLVPSLQELVSQLPICLALYGKLTWNQCIYPRCQFTSLCQPWEFLKPCILNAWVSYCLVVSGLPQKFNRLTQPSVDELESLHISKFLSKQWSLVTFTPNKLSYSLHNNQHYFNLELYNSYPINALWPSEGQNNAITHISFCNPCYLSYL